MEALLLQRVKTRLNEAIRETACIVKEWSALLSRQRLKNLIGIFRALSLKPFTDFKIKTKIGIVNKLTVMDDIVCMYKNLI